MKTHSLLPTDTAVLMARYPEIFARKPLRRAAVVSCLVAAAALAIFAAWRLEFSLARIGTGASQLLHFIGLMFPPSPGRFFWTFLHALAETLAIAFLGTLIAACLAFPVSFLAAKNVVPNIFVHVAVRRALDVFRAVDALIWALIWINVVGLGPFAGILAIATSNFGELGKLFSEAIEATDGKASDGIASTGGNKSHEIRFGLIPQVFPVIASQVLYYFESNTRSSTIIGIVGAGGIGLHLYEQIRTLEWQHVSFLILMVLVTVSLIDMISSRLRFALIGHRAVS